VTSTPKPPLAQQVADILLAAMPTCTRDAAVPHDSRWADLRLPGGVGNLNITPRRTFGNEDHDVEIALHSTPYGRFRRASWASAAHKQPTLKWAKAIAPKIAARITKAVAQAQLAESSVAAKRAQLDVTKTALLRTFDELGLTYESKHGVYLPDVRNLHIRVGESGVVFELACSVRLDPTKDGDSILTLVQAARALQSVKDATGV